MKLVIERSELLRALAHVTSVVERRTTIPILSNVLLKTSGRAPELKATDLEREVPRSGRRRRVAARCRDGAGAIFCTTSCASCPTAPRWRSNAIRRRSALR